MKFLDLDQSDTDTCIFVSDLSSKKSLNIGSNFSAKNECRIYAKNSIISIGSNVVLEPGVVIHIEDSRLELGNNVRIGMNTSLYASASSKMQIRDDSCLGGHSKITASKGSQLSIQYNVQIGSYVTIDCSKKALYVSNDVKVDSYCELSASGNINIGPSCHFWSGCYVAAFSEDFIFGEKVSLGQKALIAGRGSISVGDQTMIGGNSFIVTETHKYMNPFKNIRNQGFSKLGISIGVKSWIASGCTVLDGTKIGDSVVIGSMSLVTGLVPNYSVMMGNPARKIKDRRIVFAKLVVLTIHSSSSYFEIAKRFGIDSATAEELLGSITPNELESFVNVCRKFTDDVANTNLIKQWIVLNSPNFRKK